MDKTRRRVREMTDPCAFEVDCFVKSCQQTHRTKVDKITLDAMFLHSCNLLQRKSEGIHQEESLSSVESIALVHFDSYDKEDEKNDEADTQ